MKVRVVRRGGLPVGVRVLAVSDGRNVVVYVANELSEGEAEEEVETALDHFTTIRDIPS